MENHPIPQDVTGFKFKLIGSVTVKQFLYLLAFGIFATISFVLHINFYFRIPLMIFFASIGAALAFLPIDGRPMDTMIVNFAKTIPSENKYLYKKRGANLASYEMFTPTKIVAAVQAIAGQAADAVRNPHDDKRAMLISRLRNSSFRPDAGEVAGLKNINSYFEDGAPAAKPIPIVQPILSPEEEKQEAKEKYDAIENLVAESQEERVTAAPPEVKEKPEAQSAPQAPTETIKLSDEERTSGSVDTEPPPPMAERVNPTLSAGFPTLPDIGNVVLGIVRDARGKSLPNILVEVMDANGLPVRAFKTSSLGQFASATPLPNGKYKMYFEDPQKNHEFQGIEINLAGEIFQPIEVVSIDAREKLRRELFGGVQAAA